MPKLMIDGVIQGGINIVKIAGACEWCGTLFSAEGCCPVGDIPDDDRPFGVDRYTLLTRMCRECIEIYCKLGTDGLVELPGTP